jgi:hypothetical protein
VWLTAEECKRREIVFIYVFALKPFFLTQLSHKSRKPCIRKEHEFSDIQRVKQKSFIILIKWMDTKRGRVDPTMCPMSVYYLL